LEDLERPFDSEKHSTGAACREATFISRLANRRTAPVIPEPSRDAESPLFQRDAGFAVVAAAGFAVAATADLGAFGFQKSASAFMVASST
jgi:hypothetical protein